MSEYTLAQKQLVEEFSREEEWGLLNRLGTGTSRVLYFACSRVKYMPVRDLLRSGKVEKDYLAQVWGDVMRNVEKNYGMNKGNSYMSNGSPRFARDDGSKQKEIQDIVLRFPIMHHRHDDERMVSCVHEE